MTVKVYMNAVLTRVIKVELTKIKLIDRVRYLHSDTSLIYTTGILNAQSYRINHLNKINLIRQKKSKITSDFQLIAKA